MAGMAISNIVLVVSFDSGHKLVIIHEQLLVNSLVIWMKPRSAHYVVSGKAGYREAGCMNDLLYFSHELGNFHDSRVTIVAQIACPSYP